MKSASHIGFWLVILGLGLLVFPALISAEAMHARLVEELAAIQSVFGHRAGAFIIETSRSIYRAFLSAGLDQVVRQGIHDEADMRVAGQYFSAVGAWAAQTGSRYLASLSIQFFTCIVRAVVVIFWLVILAPFLAAAVVDGLASRKVKLATFGDQNPTAFSIGTHALIIISALPLMYIAVPWAITPMFMPLWALGAALPMALLISHSQPIFSR